MYLCLQLIIEHPADFVACGMSGQVVKNIFEQKNAAKKITNAMNMPIDGNIIVRLCNKSNV